MQSSTRVSFALNGRCALDHLGVIQLRGDDAARFIHGQLTHDFALLDLHHARLCALCSAKGRMLASFIGFKRDNGDILLVCSRDLLASTLKRLSMFVLRAKVKITDATGAFSVWGLAGNAVLANPADAARAWAKADLGPASIVQLYPADQTPRQLWVAPVDSPAPDGDDLSLSTWQWSEVCSAVATLSTPVAEAFVPQMLNYESVDGVSFKKGCYPGQEVVARSQFRGTLKRRAHVVQCEAAVAAGDEIFGAVPHTDPVGLVVQAAPAPGGGYAAIVSVQNSALVDGPLHVGSSGGSLLQIQDLPYPLLEDI